MRPLLFLVLIVNLILQILHQKASCEKEAVIKVSSHKPHHRTPGESYRLCVKQDSHTAAII